MNILDRLREQLASNVTQAEAILGRAADGETLSTTENSELERLHGAAEQLKNQIKHYESLTSSRVEADAIAGRLGDRRSESLAQAPADHGVTTLGEAFTKSQEFLSWAGRGSSAVFTSDSNLALITTGNDGRLDSVQAGRGFVPGTRTPLLDDVAKVPVNATSVEYEVFEKWVAGKVAEGDAKPEAGAFTIVNKPLITAAHWKKISRQYKADEAYLSAVISQQLVAGVTRKVESELVAAVLGTTTAAKNGGGAGKFLEGIRNAAAAIDPDLGMATHVILHPEDAAAADIQAFTNGHTGPIGGVNVWGLKTIISSQATKGTGVVFDIAGLTCYFRTGVEVYMTDSDITGDGATAKSDFRANIVTVLAEQRFLGVLGDDRLAVPGKAAA